MTYANGDMYQGGWNENEYHGKGCFVKLEEEGTIYLYDGDWVNGVKHGQGKLQWDSGKQEYDGDYLEGERTGQGVY